MNATKSRNRKQVPARSIGLVARDGEFNLLEIFDGKRPDPDYYFAKAIPSDWGTAFQLEKQDAVGLAEVYKVCLAGRDSVCDCKGFCFHQKPCKHILGLQALVAAGRLPASKPMPPLRSGLCPADEAAMNENIFG